ncbi:MAG TPA: PRC-barrel domain-containing protein [Candidatus Goldiibacteriota bacterium]|nr:PRC-barrel domain-containing protein [Candidatus Goldiibacteriota bacterium]
MIKYQDLLGKTAYSLDEGRQWGKVAELFIDKGSYAVTGLLIKGEVERALPLSSVRNIDESVIFGSAQDFVPVASAEAGMTRSSRITGLRIITENGNELGTVVSFYFKRQGGAITHYEVSKSVLRENLLISQDGIIRMGDDAAIILEEAAEVAQEMKAKNAVRQAAAKLGVKAKSFSEKAGAKAKEWQPVFNDAVSAAKKGTKAAGEKIEEFAAKARPKIREAVEKYGPKVKEQAQKAGQKAKEAADKYGPKVKEAGGKAKDAVKKAWNRMTKKEK